VPCLLGKIGREQNGMNRKHGVPLSLPGENRISPRLGIYANRMPRQGNHGNTLCNRTGNPVNHANPFVARREELLRKRPPLLRSSTAGAGASCPLLRQLREKHRNSRWHAFCQEGGGTNIVYIRAVGRWKMANHKIPLLNLNAADLMSRNIVMIPREMSLPGAARMLSRASVSGAPIVDEQGCCIGVLSTTDFMHSVEANPPASQWANRSSDPISQSWQMPLASSRPNYCVEDFMTKDPVLVGPATPIRELAKMMMDAHIHRIIVVDMATRRPIGIVSSMDILAAVARLPGDETDMEVEEPVGAYYAEG